MTSAVSLAGPDFNKRKQAGRKHGDARDQGDASLCMRMLLDIYTDLPSHMFNCYGKRRCLLLCQQGPYTLWLIAVAQLDFRCYLSLQQQRPAPASILADNIEGFNTISYHPCQDLKAKHVFTLTVLISLCASTVEACSGKSASAAAPAISVLRQVSNGCRTVQR